MKLVHAIISLETGGAEGMLARLVQESSKNPQIKQSIITLKGEGTIGHQLRMKGFDVILEMKSFLNIPIVIYKLIKLFKVLGPDAYTWMYLQIFFVVLQHIYLGLEIYGE